MEVPELVEAAAATRAHLDEVAANSVQHAALIRQLESQVDAEEGEGAERPPAEGQAAATEAGWGTLPTGDELAAEVERFLRGEQGG